MKHPDEFKLEALLLAIAIVFTLGCLGLLAWLAGDWSVFTAKAWGAILCVLIVFAVGKILCRDTDD